MKPTTYDVFLHWTSAQDRIAEDVTLATAKRIARERFPTSGAREVEILGSDGSRLAASQTIGSGLLWS